MFDRVFFASGASQGTSPGVSLRTVLGVGLLVVCSQGFLSLQVDAQEKNKSPLELGLDAERGADGLHLRRPVARNYYETPELREHERYRHYSPYSQYFMPPWGWYVPQTHKYKRYPPPVAVEPRLGLGYNYPYSYEMGIEVPGDEDPRTTYSLGPYRGVVGSPQHPEWLYRQAEENAGSGVGDAESGGRWGVQLMRQEKYKAAGGVQARGFRDSDDPRYPLLLTEVFFALGRYEHAELLLRHALAQDGVFDLLAQDVASHFPSREKFESMVEQLAGAGAAGGLLEAYLLLFSKDGAKGLDALKTLIDADASDDIAAKLYRHYLGKAFGIGKKAGGKPQT